MDHDNAVALAYDQGARCYRAGREVDPAGMRDLAREEWGAYYTTAMDVVIASYLCGWADEAVAAFEIDCARSCSPPVVVPAT